MNSLAQSPPSAPKRIAVVGAGAVGIACALALRREGHDVVVVDPREPATATSFGNAGIIANCAVEPIGMPGIVRRVPRMLADPRGPLAIRWRYLPRIAPWLARLVAASRAERVERIAAARATLVLDAVEAWRALLRGTNGARHIVARGWIHAYETDAAFAAAQPSIALRRRHGVRVDILDAGALRDLEPATAPVFRHGVYFPDSWFATHPQRLVRALAEAFAASGGRFALTRVVAIESGPRSGHRVRTGGGVLDCDHVVIAAGAWSRPLAAMLGARVPLDTERGYHVELPRPERVPQHPILSGEHKFVIAPMEEVIRITGGVELAGLEAPPDYTRIRRMAQHARRMLPGLGGEVLSEWLGYRPSLPDSLPVIGPAPRHPTALFAFGHAHIGLTAAPATARVIADVVAGRPPSLDLAPFRADRF